MLLRLRHPDRPTWRASVEATARELGLELVPLDASWRFVETRGPAGPEARSRFEDLTAVAAVLDAADAPELHVRQGEDHQVAIGQALFGAGQVSIAAGPCAVEDPERTFEIAEAAAKAGCTLLRGGAYKPRTSPHSFQGLGHKALPILDEARRRSGLAVLTEVIDPRDVDIVGQVADAFQVGARNMANSALLAELGRYGKPVVLKRGMAATVREFLLAAEYVLNEGNDQLILCERGVRSFDKVTRNLLDLGAVAHLKRATHLPVIVDPSHAAGRTDLVLPLARAGLAAGADGLLVEVHPEPIEAHSDGAQALALEDLRSLVTDSARLCDALDRQLVLHPCADPLPGGVTAS
jgi:3-deoxy-7-phosphoheptulonate synthase